LRFLIIILNSLIFYCKGYRTDLLLFLRIFPYWRDYVGLLQNNSMLFSDRFNFIPANKLRFHIQLRLKQTVKNINDSKSNFVEFLSSSFSSNGYSARNLNIISLLGTNGFHFLLHPSISLNNANLAKYRLNFSNSM